MNRWIPRFALGMVVVVCPAIAYADDPAAAEALFKEALAKYREGDYAAACPKFAESQALDPRPGTLFAMAECEAAADHIATAATLYEDFLRTVAAIKNPGQQAKYLDRMKKAQVRRDELIPEIPRLTLVLPSGSSPNVRITRNGETFTATSLGVELPVNPGEQVITVQISAGPVREQRVTIGRKERQTVVLEVPEVPAAPTVEPWGQYAAPKLVPIRVLEAGPPLRTAGFVVGGLGVAGLVAGVIAGSVILDRKPVVDAQCPDGHCKDDESLALARGLSALNVLNGVGLGGVGLGVGGVAAVAGAVMVAQGTQSSLNKEAKWNLHVGGIVLGSRGVMVGVKGAF